MIENPTFFSTFWSIVFCHSTSKQMFSSCPFQSPLQKRKLGTVPRSTLHLLGSMCALCRLPGWQWRWTEPDVCLTSLHQSGENTFVPTGASSARSACADVTCPAGTCEPSTWLSTPSHWSGVQRSDNVDPRLTPVLLFCWPGSP